MSVYLSVCTQISEQIKLDKQNEAEKAKKVAEEAEKVRQHELELAKEAEKVRQREAKEAEKATNHYLEMIQAMIELA